MLLTENPWKLMVSLSLPSIVGMVVIGLYSFMDGVFVGQLIGSAAMGAVAVSYPFTLINSGISTLVGMGSASVLSRAIGRKDKETIDKIMGNLIVLVVLLSVIVTVFGMIFTKQLLILSGASGEVLSNAVRYLRIIFIGSLFVNFAQASNMIMRGEGLLKKAMIIMGGGALLNIILDPIFITALKSSGRGIEGAAIATVISQVCQAAAMLFYFVKQSKTVRIHALKFDGALTKEVAGVGVSAMLMQVMTLIQQTIIFKVTASTGGENWQILIGAALRIQAFAFIPLWGISQGFQPCAGTNYGAKDFGRVKKLMRIFIIGATVLAAVFYIPIELFPAKVLGMFITDSSIVSMGVSDFRIMFSSYILMGFMIISATLFQSLGKGGKAAFMFVGRIVLFFLPLILLLPRTPLGIHGVWIAIMTADTLVTVIGFVMALAELRKLK